MPHESIFKFHPDDVSQETPGCLGKPRPRQRGREGSLGGTPGNCGEGSTIVILCVLLADQSSSGRDIHKLSWCLH